MFKKKYRSMHCQSCGAELFRLYPNIQNCREIKLMHGRFEKADGTPSISVIGCTKCECYWKELSEYDDEYQMTGADYGIRDINKVSVKRFDEV